MRHWAGRVLAAGAVWLLVLGGALVLRAELRVWLLAALVLAASSVVWLALDVSVATEPSSWRQDRTDPVRPPGDDRRLDALRRQLGKHLAGADSEHQVHADLVAVADQRLMARHGLSRRADPSRAEGVLGPELARFLSHGAQSRLSAGELDAILTRIEAL